MSIPTLDTLRLEMIMHRNAHFGGSFDVMIEYYRNDGVGVMPDFDIETLQELKDLEDDQDLNEALPEPAKLEVEKAQERYRLLRDVYEQEDLAPQLLSNLILSEDEQPNAEIEAIAAKGSELLPQLIDLIRADTFYNPLYPGYGRSPIFAAQCLAKIGDKEAIAPLFEAIGHENFFTDEALISALSSFGDPAKEFLLKVLSQTPVSKDNEHAAIALGAFEPDETIAKASLTLLEEKGTLERGSLAPYLIFACSALAKEDRIRFQTLINNAPLSPELSVEANAVLQTF